MKTIKILFVLLLYPIYLSAQNLKVTILPVWDGKIEEITAVNDTFKITNPRQLAWISEQYLTYQSYYKNKTIFIMNDMDLGGKSTPPQCWIPIGMGNPVGGGINAMAFIGHFDGNNKKIINVYIDSLMPYYVEGRSVGFFGRSEGTIFDSATIKNIILENINYDIPKDCNVGGILGRCEATRTTIENCHVSGVIRGQLCGGIVGVGSALTPLLNPYIKNCSSHCIFYKNALEEDTTFYSRFFAISGGSGLIESCYANCQAITSYYLGLSSRLQNCYSINGFVEQGKTLGDIAYNSYIAATQVINEVIDSNQHSVNCYYDSITYGSQSGKIAKGRGLDTAFMKTAAFVDSLNQGLSEKKWEQDYSDCPINNGFPILVWQKKKQTIHWKTIDTLFVGDYYIPTATASSGLPVSYLIYNFFNLNLFSDKFLVTQAGEVTLIAKQEGDSVYEQAPWVYKKFCILEKTYPKRDIKIDEIISPVADSCYAEGSVIFPKVKISNTSPINVSNIAVHVKVDSAGSLVRSFAETIAVIEPNKSYIFEFPFSFTVPYMPSSNNMFKTTMYINALDNDTNLHNDTLSVYSFVEQVNINENKTKLFELGQNQPNPSNASMVVPYNLPEQGNVLFKLMNIHGQVLYQRNIQSFPGTHRMEINTSRLSNGMYYYSMEYKGKVIIQKMILQK